MFSLLVTINALFSKLEASIGHLHARHQVSVWNKIYSFITLVLVVVSSPFSCQIYQGMCWKCSSIFHFSLSCNDYADWFIDWCKQLISTTVWETVKSKSRRISMDWLWNQECYKLGLSKSKQVGLLHIFSCMGLCHVFGIASRLFIGLYWLVLMFSVTYQHVRYVLLEAFSFIFAFFIRFSNIGNQEK